MKKTIRTFFLLFSMSSLIISCEKAIITEEQNIPYKGNLILKVSPYNITRSSLSESFTKINVQFFGINDGLAQLSKVYTQTSDDPNFGTLGFTLTPGTYKALVVGHSSKRSATLSNNKVSFTAQDGKKITDTFWYCQLITASEEEQTVSIELERATAMFRLIIADEIPDNVTSFLFYYTGGSADFNPNTGIGETKSTQNETREINGDIYEVYTFPRTDSKLFIRVQALDVNGTVLATKEFQDVPMEKGYITEYKGVFFSGETIISGNTLIITVNSDWEGINKFTF